MTRADGVIGTAVDGAPVRLPDDAVTQGFAILARRRSGKSTLAGVMEETFCERGDPWVCLDPVAAHWGIRYRDSRGQPGAPSGHDVLIVGGKYGDVPLSEHAGAQLAEVIVDTNISCVIDLGEAAMTAQQKFVADFAAELLRLNESPRHIFLEEAHTFVPQQLTWDNQKLVLGALSKMITMGGGKGIGYTLITQRAAAVAKSVLEQIDNLFVLRMSGPRDLKAIQDWFEHNVGDPDEMKRILATLRAFRPGEAWWLSDAALTRLEVRQRATYHAGRTPRRGEQPVRVERAELPRVIERFRAAAEQRQITIQQERDLKAENAELRKRIAAAEKGRPVAPPDETAIQRRVDQALAGERKASAAQLAEAERRTRTLERVIEQASRELVATREKLAGAMNGTLPKAAPVSRPLSPLRRYDPEPKPRAPASRPASREGNELNLPAGALRMLRELAARHPLRWTQAQLGGLTGFSHRGGTFRTYRGLLKRHDLIVVDGREIAVTDAGLALAGDVPAAPTDHTAAMAMWAAKLPAGAYRMLQAAAEADRPGLSQDEWAELTGFERAGGTFRTYRGILKRNGLITISDDQVYASDILFPETL